MPDEDKKREWQAKADSARRNNKFNVRLGDQLAAKVRHFMESRNYNQNQALKIILSKFFK